MDLCNTNTITFNSKTISKLQLPAYIHFQNLLHLNKENETYHITIMIVD